MSTPATQLSWVPEWSFADRLRKIRRGRSFSQDAFAALLNVRPATYAAWETGRNSPDQIVALAKRIELVAGVPAAWTLGVYAEIPRPGDPDGGEECAIRDSNPEPADRTFGPIPVPRWAVANLEHFLCPAVPSTVEPLGRAA